MLPKLSNFFSFCYWELLVSYPSGALLTILTFKSCTLLALSLLVVDFHLFCFKMCVMFFKDYLFLFFLSAMSLFIFIFLWVRIPCFAILSNPIISSQVVLPVGRVITLSAGENVLAKAIDYPG